METPLGDGVGASVGGSPQALRAVMGRFVSGVTIVSALHQGQRHAMTATAVCSVSLDPPLILVCVGRSSRCHAAITQAPGWAVSLLAAEQQPIARHFAHSGRDLATQFDTVPHFAGPATGSPVLSAALAWVECTTHAQWPGGDHTIVVGRVIRAGEVAERPSEEVPLTYYQGFYRAFPAGGEA